MLRATLKSMLSRKLRLLLSTTAVVLGVMFVSGALVLTDTLGRSFDQLFTNIYSYTDVEVNKPGKIGITGQEVPALMPASDVDRVAKVPGVASAVGTVFVDGARVIDKNNKVVLGSGGPRFGGNWTGTNELTQLRSGRGPTAGTEIVLSANLVATTGYQLGDQVGILAPYAPRKQTFTLVGVVGYIGGRDSLAGETAVLFTEPVAQKLMLGETGVFNVIEVKAAEGVTTAQLRDRIAGALGGDYQVRTGEQLAADSSQGIKDLFKFFGYLLLGFAGVALFVGIFLILNTFSIIVAQRTRELALLRAIGAGRRQVIASVLTEAVVIGVASSVVGLGLGVAIGALLGSAMGGFLSGGALQVASLRVPLSAVLAAFGVGVGVTVVAALLPAVRASRIPPVAAMRDAAIPDRPLGRLTAAGAVVLAAGGVILGLGLTGNLGGGGLAGVLGGLLACFVGVALLTPVIARPVVGLIGRTLSWSAAGDLGRRNSARNPRRTAITAAALMVSIALVTGISVIFSSIRASTVKAIDDGVDAQLVVGTDVFNPGLGAIDPATLDQIRHLPGVTGTVGFFVDRVSINGNPEFVTGLDDPATAVRMFRVERISGELLPLGPGQVIVDDGTAADRSMSAGSTITVELPRGGEREFTVAGIYRRTAVNTGFFFGPQDSQTGFSQQQPIQGYISVAPGTDVASVRNQVNELLKDSPEISVSTLDDLIAQQTRALNFVLVFVQGLLGLAMLIAVLGIINTLALSMTERTRELGLLRAVGMKQGQVMWMVTVESVMISVFGALLGLAVGIGLGASVFQALRDQGFTELALPWTQMVIYAIASVFVGLAAGFIPAVRSTRLDVLAAIAYE